MDYEFEREQEIKEDNDEALTAAAEAVVAAEMVVAAIEAGNPVETGGSGSGSDVASPLESSAARDNETNMDETAIEVGRVAQESSGSSGADTNGTDTGAGPSGEAVVATPTPVAAEDTASG